MTYNVSYTLVSSDNISRMKVFSEERRTCRHMETICQAIALPLYALGKKCKVHRYSAEGKVPFIST